MGTSVGPSTSKVGGSAELRACVWLLDQGFEVFRNVCSVGPIDIVAVKDGKAHFFDVKHKSGTLTPMQAAIGVSLLVGDGTGGFEVIGADEKLWQRLRAKNHIFKVRRRYPSP